jgi:hypothetical protein
MSISRFFRAASVALGVVAIFCVAPLSAEAKPKPPTVGVRLRVVDPALVNDFAPIIYTTTTSIPTSKHATCFGAGTGGSGRSLKLKGPTALGLVQDASKVFSFLKPSVTDHFDFGPGLCGIGSSVASGSAYWDLIVNHETSQVGGAQRVHDGDEVLWYLAPSYPPGPELQLKVPAVVPSGGDYQATVYQFDPDTGARTPAQGVTVDFASSPTDAQGHTTIHISGSSGTGAGVGATRPSDAAIADAKSVCIGTAGSCGRVNEIYGSPQDDRVKGTGQSDFIAAGKGDDKVNITGGGPDLVNCGAGKDTVVIQKGDSDDKIRSTCEKVVKR